MLRGCITSESKQGGRYYQEDRLFFVLMPDLKKIFSGCLLAVMDGHGGSEVSEFCFKNLMETFLKVSNNGRSKIEEDVLRKMVGLLAEKTKSMDAGSTLSLVYINEIAEIASVAVLGDSPVIIKDSSGKIVISPEHNIRSNESERRSAIEKGAVYHDPGYIGSKHSDNWIQMSRVLGNQSLNDILSREPETYSVKLGPNSFVLVASDGLLDPSHGERQSLVDFITFQIDNGAAARDLVDNAVNFRKTGDNVTAVLWRALKN